MATSSVIARIFFNRFFLFNLTYLSQCIHMNQLYNVLLIEALITVFPFSLPLNALLFSEVNVTKISASETLLMCCCFYITISLKLYAYYLMYLYILCKCMFFCSKYKCKDLLQTLTSENWNLHYNQFLHPLWMSTFISKIMTRSDRIYGHDIFNLYKNC